MKNALASVKADSPCPRWNQQSLLPENKVPSVGSELIACRVSTNTSELSISLGKGLTYKQLNYADSRYLALFRK
ncbi:hypothetical protein H5410_011595, partial [Solanum commersonii]